MADDEQLDWRVGLKVTPKMIDHPMAGIVATVVSVGPSGTGGLFDPDGVLLVEFSKGCRMLTLATEWMTA